MQNNRSSPDIRLRWQIVGFQLNLSDRFEIFQFSIQMYMFSVRQKA